MKGYLTIRQAAEYTQLSSSTLRRRINEGKLPILRYSSKILIPLSALDDVVYRKE